MHFMLSRRQALKTGVAGMVEGYCSPLSAYANTTQLDMNQFCAAESTEKYELTEPWTRLGYCYATDQSICVRVMSLEPDTLSPANGLSYPPVSDLPWHELSQVGLWTSWPQRPPQGASEFPDYAVKVVTSFPKIDPADVRESYRAGGPERIFEDVAETS